MLFSNRNRRGTEGATYGSDGTSDAVAGATAGNASDEAHSDSEDEEGESSNNVRTTAEVVVHRPWGTYTR